jgi:hypothetical protein
MTAVDRVEFDLRHVRGRLRADAREKRIVWADAAEVSKDAGSR